MKPNSKVKPSYEQLVLENKQLKDEVKKWSECLNDIMKIFKEKKWV